MEVANSVNELVEELYEDVIKQAKALAKNHKYEKIVKDLDDFESEAGFLLLKVVKEYFPIRHHLTDNPDSLRQYVKIAVRFDLIDYIRKLKSRKLYPLEYDVTAPDERDVLGDVIDCCSNDIEKEIITLRSQGHTLETVSKRTGVSISTLSRTLKRIETRYIGLFE